MWWGVTPVAFSVPADTNLLLYFQPSSQVLGNNREFPVESAVWISAKSY